MKDNNKEYLLFAFAYPSGSGLHVGHVESMTALDIYARFLRMQGKDVYFPVGWDAFGLPAENYAIETGIHPAKTTKDAINTFRRQIKALNISYDWQNEIATSHPEYYKWTQWIFLQLYAKKLAYQGDGMVNWCPSCQTVLANEQVVEGACERCEALVEQKNLKQWYFKITQYQDELLDDLEKVDWPEPTKQQQRNWIGKSDGIQITFEVVGSNETIDCFTTWPTNWGASFLVLSPEHPLVKKVTKLEKKSEVENYLEEVKSKSEAERLRTRDKTGVFTGSYVKNHVTGEEIPIWISDFVLMHVGTGAVQGCPGHDMRDFQFAKKFGIKIPRVVVGKDGDESPIERPEQVIEKGSLGKMVNSDLVNGMEYAEGIAKTMDYFEEKNWGKRVTTYKLRDWLISRQRYWGAPIPIVYDPEGNPHPVKEEHLPWLLPTDVDFKPTGESPLTTSKEFIERTEMLYGKGWRPEFDTMDTFVDSSWYYLRYTDARNTEVFASKDKLAEWLPIDLYLIGPEHIVLHLLYSRFFTKFLRDEGHIDVDEPFAKMRHQGMILGPDGKKMSKSKGNVINPDKIVDKYGADTLRLYEMFMGPLETDKPWDDGAVAGISRFLKRVKKLASVSEDRFSNPDLVRKLHQTIKKVGGDIPALKFNTAIAMMMEFVNLWEKKENLSQEDTKMFISILAPFAPDLAKELGQSKSWPKFSPDLIVEESVIIPVQVNGKIRGELEVGKDDIEDKKLILIKAKELKSVIKWIKDKNIKKEIYVPGRLVSLATVK
jgi:leucyl-tRNA synthetase